MRRYLFRFFFIVSIATGSFAITTLIVYAQGAVNSTGTGGRNTIQGRVSTQ